MTAIRLSRRRLLQSACAGTLAAPFLRALPSRAQGGELPRYLILLFTPCGVVQPLWGAQCPQPPRGGAASASPLVLRDSLRPLTPIQDHVIVLEGLKVAAADGTHEAGMGALWTGKHTTRDGQGPSLDQAVAAQLNAALPFSSIELAARGAGDLPDRETRTRMIYAAAGRYVDPLSSPLEARSALFPGIGTPPNGDRVGFIRERVLSDLNAELSRLTAEACADDRAQLSAMQQAWNDVDRQLTSAASAARNCPAAVPSIEPSESFPTNTRLQMDLLALALACDLTRVASLQLSTATSQLTHEWLGSDQKKTHHEYSHDGPPAGNWLGADVYDPANGALYTSLNQLAAIDRWYAEQVFYLAKALDQFSVGGESLLSRSVICWGSEVAIGAAHNHDNAPFVLIGGGGGKLKTNQVVRFSSSADRSGDAPKERCHNDLLLTLAEVMGVKLASFGDSELCVGPIREILP